MGLYFRRSVRVGPLRFNFSTSGIGVSAGIPGFRVGTGPRGAYVRMGARGVYYRQSLGSPRTRRGPGPVRVPTFDPSSPQAPDFSVGPMQEIDSTSVLELTDSSSQALLEEIQHRQSARPPAQAGGDHWSRWHGHVGRGPLATWCRRATDSP
jgi:hypothetical protein